MIPISCNTCEKFRSCKIRRSENLNSCESWEEQNISRMAKSDSKINAQMTKLEALTRVV